jgi:hypothetical protein
MKIFGRPKLGLRRGEVLRLRGEKGSVAGNCTELKSQNDGRMRVQDSTRPLRNAPETGSLVMVQTARAKGTQAIRGSCGLRRAGPSKWLICDRSYAGLHTALTRF